MRNSKKEKTAIAIGFVFIALIALATFFRPQFSWQSFLGVFSEKSERLENLPVTEDILSDYASVSSTELQSKLNSGSQLLLLDIRDSIEFEREHIVDSLNVSLDTLAERMPALPDNQAIVISYGADHQDIAKAMRILASDENKKLSAGYLRGGLTEWKKNKGRLIGWGDPVSFEEQSKVTYISKDELKKLVEGQAPIFILDTGQPAVFSAAHLPGAVNIPFNLLEAQRSEIPKAKEIIVYGETEIAGFQSGVKLYDLGFLAARVYRGGMSEWDK